jgi:pSer/pThr/pTyr-binding forkhead associated (FHA) protein
METPISNSIPAPHMVIEEASEPGSIGQQIDIAAYPFVLGRILSILSTEIGVSRQHAEVNYDPQTNVFTLIDLQSTNGVTIGGQTILSSNAYEIKGETRIGLGPNVILKFVVNQS